MKKSLKIITIIFTIFCIIALINNIFAIDFEDYRPTELRIEDDSPYYAIGGTVISIIRTIAIIVCVATLAIVGITMMYGSIEQKAEYKKKLLPIVIGAFFVVGTTSILKILMSNVNESYIIKEQNKNAVEVVSKIKFDLDELAEDENYLNNIIEGLIKEQNKYTEATDQRITRVINGINKIKSFSNGVVITGVKNGTSSIEMINKLGTELNNFYNNPDVFIKLSELQELNFKLEEYYAYRTLYNELEGYDAEINNPFKMHQLQKNANDNDFVGSDRLSVLQSKLNGLISIRSKNIELGYTQDDLYDIYKANNSTKLAECVGKYYEILNDSTYKYGKYTWGVEYCKEMYSASVEMCNYIGVQRPKSFFFK